MPDRELTIEVMRELIDYDPQMGTLTWRARRPEMFVGADQRPEHSCKIWNSRNAGRPALATPNGNGYLHGAIFGKTITAHKAAWAIYHGTWPVHGIDHQNGETFDNRIINLRDVPDAENAKNQKRSKRNTSGVTGVTFNRATGKWVASIKGGGRQINLGYYPTIEEAAAVRKIAERRFGFHPNHGRIAA